MRCEPCRAARLFLDGADSATIAVAEGGDRPPTTILRARWVNGRTYNSTERAFELRGTAPVACAVPVDGIGWRILSEPGEPVEDVLLRPVPAGVDPKTAFDPNGLPDELRKALAERALNAGMDHLAGDSDNRNGYGYGRKSVVTDTG